MNKSHAAHVVKPKRADRLQSTKCQPRATRPQAPFQGPPHGLVFYLDDGVNGTTIPQTQQTQHAHIMRVHLAGCCKGQAQQHEINLGRAPRAYVVNQWFQQHFFCAQRGPPVQVSAPPGGGSFLGSILTYLFKSSKIYQHLIFHPRKMELVQKREFSEKTSKTRTSANYKFK